MKVKVILLEKEVLRPILLPKETKEFDLSTKEGLFEYNTALLEAIKDERIAHVEALEVIN